MKKGMMMRLSPVIVGLFLVVTAQVPGAQEKFDLPDIPKIKNRKPIHVALESGGGSKLIIPLVKKFSEHTGIKVTYESLIMSQAYPKQNLDLVSGTGAYDIVVVEASTTNEWAPYLWPVKELAQEVDPGGLESLEAALHGQHPIMLRCDSDVDGKAYGLPYKTYHQAMFIRKDAFDHPIEKKNFKEKYGYELAPATTWKQLHDQAQFFTRKKGELLKGEPLKEDLYGTAVMAGRYEINDEISARIWSYGQDWATLVRDENGRPKEFVITKKDKEALRRSLQEYKDLLPYSSPGCLTGFWDFVTAQYVAGKTIIIPHLYVSLHKWASTVEDKIPGAKYALYPVVGNRGYTGNWYQSVAKSSKNPEAAYWLMRYLTSYEAQRPAMEKGWSGTRWDFVSDVKYQEPKWRRIVAQRSNILMHAWSEPGYYDFVNDLFFFNSDAAGKIYEVQIILCHEAMTGKSIDETVKEMTKQTIELQKKFGTLPIREEK